MAQEFTYCDRCGARFTGYRRFCPHCGAVPSVTETLSTRMMGGWFGRLPRQAQTLILLVFFGGIFAGILYAARLRNEPVAESKPEKTTTAETKKPVREKRPDKLVPVTVGEFVVCKRCYRVMKDSRRRIRVPESDIKKHKVDKKEILCDICEKAASICRAHADWSFESCRDLARNRVTEGMNEAQVRYVWGEPAQVTRTQVGRREMIEWRYGDPVYNIPVPNRYVIFTGGKAVHLSGNEWQEEQ